jgi:hypothetical protein
MNGKRRSFIGALLFIPLISLGADEAFKLVRQDPQGITVEFSPKRYDAVPLSVDGKTYVRFSSLGSGSTGEEGRPDLPIEGMLIGLPPNTIPFVTIQESRFENDQVDGLAPVPQRKYTEDGETITSYEIDRAFYSAHNQFYPSAVVAVGEISELRNQRVAKLSVAPLQYNPVQKTVKRVLHLQFRIDFREDGKSSETWRPALYDDPHFEPVYKELILNHDQSKQWRGQSGPSQPPTYPDTTGSWFAPGRPYFRIPIAQDGLYRLTAAQMLAAGINLSSVDFSTLAIYHRGKSIPALVANTTPPESAYVDFYGRRNFGSTTYFNQFSDTNTYFLTWNDTSARRFRPDSVMGSPQVQPQWYIHTHHAEKDSDYFFGTTDAQVRNTEHSPGEGWYWRIFNQGTNLGFAFSVDTVKRGTGVPVLLRVRLHGRTICGCFGQQNCSCRPPSRHNATFRMNGTLLGDVNWIDTTEVIYTTTFADSILRSGNNVLEIRSKIWAAADSNITQFHLDWFEVEYPRPFHATSEQLLFTYPATAGLVEFKIQGMAGTAADIYDLTNGRKLPSATPVAGAQLADIYFRDTLSTERQYLVIAPTVRLQPLPLTQSMTTNLRATTNGADYIVVTHPRFRSAANRVANHRRISSRLRTIVVEVQDVYDQFAFGVKNETAIRDFLRHAYYQWRRPSPTYVMLMGDASWDYKRVRPTSVKVDYVPAYGNPPSDNALVSFHPVQRYLPYMLIGRVSVEDSIQAERVVSKIIAYDAPPVGEWNKSFLLSTGGISAGEKSLFNFYSDRHINNVILPHPIGGLPLRIYKTSDAVIDGEFTDTLKSLIRDGILYYNFIGHSGGRILNVDPGSPNDFENTDGKLFFMNSTSCWIGFFSAPNSNVYSEDLLRADNRGAVAAWAASFTDDAATGDVLTTKFLSSIQRDYARSFGQLTTIARLHFWSTNFNTTPTVIAVLHQHPLLGDPYSMMALPQIPDLAFKDSALGLSAARQTQDSIATLKVKLWNYGLVPTDSVRLSIVDSYTDVYGKFQGIRTVMPSILLAPTRTVDSILIPWDVRGQAGTHALTAILDSGNAIQELTKSNNTTGQSFYVYLNTIASLKPPPFSTSPPGPVTLTAAVPVGNDTTEYQYFFEVDTVHDFSSNARIQSPPIAGSPVAAIWVTPSLTTRGAYFWRARTHDGSKYGAWEASSFRINDTLPATGKMRWRQSGRGQLASGTHSGTVATDSGVTMTRTNGLPLFVRSVGNRGSADQDFYSIIRVGSRTIFGHWWDLGNSFIVSRINEFTGDFEYRAFNVSGSAPLADSMANYIQNTPNGRYVAITVIFNGRTNVNENLWQKIESLGSVNIRSVQPGHAWALISRKGPSGPLITPIESWSPTAVAVCSVFMPTYYQAGNGAVLSPRVGPVHQWHELRWQGDTSAEGTSLTLKVLGIRPDLLADTLFTIPTGQSVLDLSAVNPAQYPQMRLLGSLSTLNPEYSPKLLNWEVDFVPPMELATGARAFAATPSVVNRGDPLSVEMDVYNLGYRRADSVRVRFSLLGSEQALHEVVIDSIGIDGIRHISAQVPTATMPLGENNLETKLVPRAGDNDLYGGNNTVVFPFTVTGTKKVPAAFRITFDDVEIVNGDYVAPTPRIRIEFPKREESDSRSSARHVLVNGQEVRSLAKPSAGDDDLRRTSTATIDRVFEFQPRLQDGSHELHVFQKTGENGDSAGTTIGFHVSSTTSLMNVVNYPNPFKRETYFTFTMTGARAPEEIRIRIYTVAGRVIKELRLDPAHVKIGYNRVAWDGRDEDGDEVANGYYFYKVIARSEGKSVETVQRLAKVR